MRATNNRTSSSSTNHKEKVRGWSTDARDYAAVYDLWPHVAQNGTKAVDALFEFLSDGRRGDC